MLIKITFFLAFLVLASVAEAQKNSLQYPKTAKIDHSDDYFGTKIADPYRWLEDDNSAQTAEWVKAQNALTFGYLKQIPFRETIKKRLTEIWNYERYGAPFKAGENYLFYKNNGLQNQSVLFVQKDLNSTPEVLLDPNTLSADGTVALGSVSASKNGKYLAYSVSKSGSDWQEIYVMEIESKKLLAEKIENVKFSGISWAGEGFYYSRYPKPKEGEALKGKNQFHQLWYHKIGTAQTEDQMIKEDKEKPNRNFYADVTEDERFLLLYPSETTYGNMLLIKDLTKPNSDFVTLIDNFENEHNVVGNDGDKLFIQTNLKASNGKLVVADISNPKPEHWKDLIPETENVLNVGLAGGKIFANYLIHARSAIKQYDYLGKFEREIELPAIGTAGGFGGNTKAKDLFYTFTSFNYPTTIFKYSIETGKSEVFRKPEVKFDPSQFTTEQIFYKSKDGTKVPMFLTYKKGLKRNGKNPTILYGYGGFNINLTPSFSIANIVWLENGGVYAVANIRGGNEYGEKWHEAGTKMKKQNVFDDFIAAAEFLQSEKYTSKDYLAVSGGSNGGLLVGAVMTQRPELFKVAFPAVGVLDMLRYQQFTIGRAWSADYGTAEDSKEMFEYLKKYSPLHSLKKGTNYPATMVTTADHDDRVVPAHSFKFAATLQETHKGSNPVLIRIEEKAGHGAGKPVSKTIDEAADKFAFAFFCMNAWKK